MKENWIEVFRAGTHTAMNGTTRTWTEQDLDDAVAAYDPAQHEAPLVVGHPQDNAPAYGWVAAVKREGSRLLIQPHQLDPAFREMVKTGRFKKRSISFYADGSIRHIGFLGAQPPAVKGLKDVQFSQDGEAVTVEWAPVGRGRAALDALLAGMRSLVAQFQDRAAEEGVEEEGREEGSPIEAQMAREEAMSTLVHIKEIFCNEMYQIVENEELAPDEKKAQLSVLVVELKGLIDQHAEQLINSFAERSEEMADPKVGAIMMTPDQLQQRDQALIDRAQASFAEQQSKVLEERVRVGVKEGLQEIHDRARRGEIQSFCERLRERGLKPALISDTGLAVFMEQLDTASPHSFAEGNGQQTPAAWFEAFLGKILDANKDGTLVVNFSEISRGRKVEGGDAKARALADYAENREVYDKFDITPEDLERTAAKLKA